jgi:hypothetical protein
MGGMTSIASVNHARGSEGHIPHVGIMVSRNWEKMWRKVGKYGEKWEKKEPPQNP